MERLKINIDLTEWELIPLRHREENLLELYFLCFNIEIHFKQKF